MRFMIMIKATADSEAGKMPGPEVFEAVGKYNESLVNAGILLAAEGLHPSKKGTKVKFSDGKPTVVDGPFTEAKELIAGFWIIKAGSLEEATEWAKRCPSPPKGETELEVRQVFDMEDFGESFTPELREQEERHRAQAAAQQ